MNEKVKGLVIGAVVLAALGGTLWVLKLTGADKVASDDSSSLQSEQSSSSEVDESVQLIDTAVSDIKQIDITNSFGGFTYLAASDSGKTGASVAELKGLELASVDVSLIGENMAQLTAYRLAEKGAAELDKYGLSDPEASFKITFADGSERTFLIGILANETRYRYLCEQGSNDVYMVLTSTLSPLVSRKEQLLNNQLLAAASDDADFGMLTVSRADLDYDIVFETDNDEHERSNADMPSAQVMTEPIFSYLNGTTSTDIIYSLYGLTAKGAEIVFPTEDDLAEYGLDAPRTIVTFVGEGYDYKLNIGNEYHEVNEDGLEQTAVSAYYCTIEGVTGKDCIWMIDASALPWVDLTPGDVITTLMTWNMVTEVSELKISGDGGADFKLTSAVDGDNTKLSSVTCDGKTADLEAFKELYQFVMTCPTSEIYFTDPDSEPYITIEIICTDGYTDKIELYNDTDRRSIVKLNGRTSYRIQSKWADRLIKNIKAVRSGGTVEQDY